MTAEDNNEDNYSEEEPYMDQEADVNDYLSSQARAEEEHYFGSVLQQQDEQMFKQDVELRIIEAVQEFLALGGTEAELSDLLKIV